MFIILVIHAGSDFPAYYGVVIFRMPKFEGAKAQGWLTLGVTQIREIFKIVRTFHEVNVKNELNIVAYTIDL